MSITLEQHAVIEGATPVAPRFGLRTGADILTDIGGRPAEGGVALDSYPAVKAARWHQGTDDDSCASLYVPGTDDDSDDTKGAGAPVDVGEGFNALTVLVELECTTVGAIRNGLLDRTSARAKTLLAALAYEALERELMTGHADPLTPHLTSDLGDADHFPLSDTATDPFDGVATLENAIAQFYGRGPCMIHMSPGLLNWFALRGFDINVAAGQKLTLPSGTIIVAGYGYAPSGDGTIPVPETSGVDSAVTTVSQEWIFATPIVQVFEGQVIDQSEDAGEALARDTNDVVVRVEQAFAYSWDTQFKSAVLVDRAA